MTQQEKDIIRAESLYYAFEHAYRECLKYTQKMSDDLYNIPFYKSRDRLEAYLKGYREALEELRKKSEDYKSKLDILREERKRSWKGE